MATTHRNLITTLPTTVGALYTAPAATTVIFTSLEVTNTTAAAITISVSVTDTSASATRYKVRNLDVPSYGTVNLVDTGKLVLETTDVLNGLASAAGIDVVASLAELT